MEWTKNNKNPNVCLKDLLPGVRSLNRYSEGQACPALCSSHIMKSACLLRSENPLMVDYYDGDVIIPSPMKLRRDIEMLPSVLP
jgi:hypothetical protein